MPMKAHLLGAEVEPEVRKLMDHAAETTGGFGTPLGHVEAAKRWTPADFAAAFDLHWRTLWSIAAAVMNDRVGAEDAVQEAALIAMEKLHQFDPQTNFAAWMGSIVRYTALNHARRHGRDASAARVEDAHPSARAATAAETLDPRFASALDVLDPIARACLVLRTMNDLSYREIAAALEIPEGTAMSHVHRSRATLRQLLASPHQKEALA